MKKSQSGWRMFFFYNAIPIVSNAAVLLFTSLVITNLINNRANFEQYRQVILENRLNNFIVNILPFPLIMAVLFFLEYPALRLFSRAKEHPRYELGLRRMLNAPFNVGLWCFIGWVIGNALSRAVYAMRGIELETIVLVRVVGMSVVSGILSFVINYYLLTLVNRKFFLPFFFPNGGMKEVAGGLRLGLRFNLEIFVLAIATGPILLLGLSLLSIQSLVPVAERPSYATSMGLVIGLILLGFFMSALLARSLRRPLGRMRNAAEAIERGEYSVQLPVDTTDEVGDLAFSINKMAHGLAEKEKIKESFGRAVDPRVRDYLLASGGEMGGAEVEATILFSDIRGFTSFSESHSAPEVVAWLNTYFERMAECVREHGGIVNKYVGDAILAVFNAPLPLADHTQAAVRCALAMLTRLGQLNAELRTQGIPEVNIGIGLHTGTVVAGNIGSRDRQEFTVIGDTVNTASRIEGLCKSFQAPLLVSERVFSALPETNGLERLGRAKVKGKSGELVIYGLKRLDA
ncbi:MAG: adenylate/guanylate cyclase domain-containing protein [Turneriella sp.]|nr:adenylate/guanylate cyclase domain-containing protein [Turneriella sp.]